MATKKTKGGDPSGHGLLNWPPSRGPRPAWMTAKPEVTIPDLKIERLDRCSSLPERVPVKPVKGPARKATSTVSLAAVRARHDAQRVVRMHLSHSVEDMLTLDTWTRWRLVHGVEVDAPDHVGPVVSVVRLVHGAAYKDATATPVQRARSRWRLESDLPARTLVVDLAYPLSCLARVTVEPLEVTTRYGKNPSPENFGLAGRTRLEMPVGYFLWQIARAYQRVYRAHKAYGVWGHAMSDLVFEGLRIEDNLVTLDIGS